MYLRHLSVTDFRSWPNAEIAFEPGAAVLVGSNGQGKTNLIEAVGYLTTLGSHRVPTDAPLVRSGAAQAVVQAAVVAAGRELRVELTISPGRANRARLNGSPVPRPRDVLGAVRSVLFAPEDLAIVRGDPAERRRFLDELAVARSPRIAAVRADYDRVLKQRAALLKSAGAARRGGSGDLSTLDVWDGHLATHGAALTAARLRALAALRPLAAAAYAQVAPQSAPLTARYVSSLGEAAPPEPPAPAYPFEPSGASGPSTPSGPSAVAGSAGPGPDELETALEQALLAELARRRPVELERGVNLVGPHRDDLELGLGELPVRGYASHGEGWSVALALRLGTFDLLRADQPEGAEPILILDDVFAELDGDRREQLALVAAKAEQVLVTAAVPTDVPEQVQGALYEVAQGQVRRVR